MRIGYSKVGRAWKLDPRDGTATGGDADVARTLHLLSRMYPEHTFVLTGRCTEIDPAEAGYPENVVNPWIELRPKMRIDFKDNVPKKASGQLSPEGTQYILDWYVRHTRQMFMDCDQHIVWAGQHGTSNSRIPMVEDRSTFTNPQDSFVLYSSFVLDGINHWRDVDPNSREELWLCPDPRNYLKCRDLKWPLKHPIIAQHEYARSAKHERYGDTTDPATWDSKWDPKSGEGVWISPSKYAYSALEMTALPSPAIVGPLHTEFNSRSPFGMLVNENRAYVAKDRLSITREWGTDQWPEMEIFGKWSKASMEALGREIEPVPYDQVFDTLRRWKTTLTTPASGSGWATAKPWECFAAGTVCFFHPHYDSQNWILRDAPKELQDWLRVDSLEALKKRVDHLNERYMDWEWLVAAQYDYFVQKYNETQGGVLAIRNRLDAACR